MRRTIALCVLAAGLGYAQMTFPPPSKPPPRPGEGDSYDATWDVDVNGDVEPAGIWMSDRNGDSQPLLRPVGIEGYWEVDGNGDITVIPL